MSKLKTKSDMPQIRRNFVDKLEWEGGLEGLYSYNRFKDAPKLLAPDEAAVFKRLAEAMDEAQALLTKWRRDNLLDDDE